MVSRRIYNADEAIEGFTHYRVSDFKNLLSGLLIYSLDSILIYDPTRKLLIDFVNLITNIDPPLFYKYFSQINIQQITIKQFDSVFSLFAQYFDELSNHFYDYLQISRDDIDSCETLLRYFSLSFKIPLIALINAYELTVDGQSCTRLHFLHMKIAQDQVYFYYPSLRYTETIKLKTCHRCRDNHLTLDDCGFGCSICKKCWVESLNDNRDTCLLYTSPSPRDS